MAGPHRVPHGTSLQVLSIGSNYSEITSQVSALQASGWIDNEGTVEMIAQAVFYHPGEAPLDMILVWASSIRILSLYWEALIATTVYAPNPAEGCALHTWTHPGSRTNLPPLYSPFWTFPSGTATVLSQMTRHFISQPYYGGIEMQDRGWVSHEVLGSKTAWIKVGLEIAYLVAFALLVLGVEVSGVGGSEVVGGAREQGRQ